MVTVRIRIWIDDKEIRLAPKLRAILEHALTPKARKIRIARPPLQRIP